MFVCVYPASPTAALTAALVEAGYQPVPVEGGDDVEARAPTEGWAAAVVEVTEDLGRCLAFAGKLNEESGIPVLLVVDRTLTAELADEGAIDDFLLSPIDRTELRVRLTRLSGRSGSPDPGETLRFRDLELNTATYQATVATVPVDLTFMEYELLRFFVENPARVWSRDQILAKVWGYDYFGGSRTVDVHVRRLRAKLGEERSSWITTVRSVGYRFG